MENPGNETFALTIDKLPARPIDMLPQAISLLNPERPFINMPKFTVSTDLCNGSTEPSL